MSCSAHFGKGHTQWAMLLVPMGVTGNKPIFHQLANILVWSLWGAYYNSVVCGRIGGTLSQDDNVEPKYQKVVLMNNLLPEPRRWTSYVLPYLKTESLLSLFLILLLVYQCSGD